MDCTATIYMKEVIKFPDFKVGNKGVVNINNKFTTTKPKKGRSRSMHGLEIFEMLALATFLVTSFAYRTET